MIVTATQIKVESVVGFIRFILLVKKIRYQLSNVDGLMFVKFNGLRTFTGWESYEAMKAFRNKGHHLDAMKNIQKIGKGKSVTWVTKSEPDWNVATEKLLEVPFRV